MTSIYAMLDGMSAGDRNSFILMMSIWIPLSIILAFGVLYMRHWIQMQRRRQDREEKKFEMEMRQREIEIARGEIGIKQGEMEIFRSEKANEGVRVVMNTQPDPALNAGAGSGGYIIIDMPEKHRPLFHDLLKGFEDYAKLKGYTIAFSIDSTFDGRIAFKFTVKDEGISVGAERVRKDFYEYVERVQSKDIEEFDNMPVVTSIEEHNLLVTLLKNRIIFLRHSYDLSQNAVRYYQGLMENVRTFPALPAASVIVQTGGSMDSRKYNAVHSPKAIQGDNNFLTDNSINIGESFNQKQERLAALDDLLSKMKTDPNRTSETEKAERALEKVKSEMTDEAEPDAWAIKRWLETAKNSLLTAALGYEAIEAGRKLFELFGLS